MSKKVKCNQCAINFEQKKTGGPYGAPRKYCSDFCTKKAAYRKTLNARIQRDGSSYSGKRIDSLVEFIHKHDTDL